MNILAVIPARGGSKGIPKKNIRLMNGQPLIAYAIKNGLNSKYITDVVVTTDDKEIEYISKQYGAEVIKRDPKLADDKTTLDPVIYDAMVKDENKKNKKYDIIITLQPTSPVLKTETLDKAIEQFLTSDYDTYISATNKPHLSWTKNNGKIVPSYEKRVNRQQLPPNYLEAGAFFISKRDNVTENTRIGKNVSVYEIPEEESTDIDNSIDWVICENILRKKKIVFRCDGYKELGMGHIYHCLTLAYNLTGHDVIFVTNKNHLEGLNKIAESNMKYTTIENDEQFFDFLENYKPDIVVNDCLDTTEKYIKKIKMLSKKVVTIEDLGEGAKYADIIINALYDNKRYNNEYCGEEYVCLRNEFLISKPKEFSQEVKEVLILFGGTDPSNLTKKVYNMIKENYSKYPNIHYNFITGIGYDCEKNEIVQDDEKNIRVLKNVSNISEYMSSADLAFTSQGRTVYELASMGVPSIVMAQNERETLHKFAQMTNGFMNLGLGKDLSIETIFNTFDWLIKTPQIRKEMRDLMLKKNIKDGIKNEIELILK